MKCRRKTFCVCPSFVAGDLPKSGLEIGLALVIGVSLASMPAQAEQAEDSVHQHGLRTATKSSVQSSAVARATRFVLPPVPPGVTDLRFSEFFLSPVGDRGLQLSERLRNLDGKRVRLLGYMVRQGESVPGLFLLAPLPLQTHEHEYGLCDDLPAATVHVIMPAKADKVVPYTPGLLLLTGTLSVGNRQEKDGRISLVRLSLERPPDRKKRKTWFHPGKGAERLRTSPPAKRPESSAQASAL